MRTTNDSERLLRGALVVNAVFSGLSALMAIPFRHQIATWVAGLTPGLVLGVAAALAVFALTLVVAARRRPLRPGDAWAAVVLDAGWVAGTIALALAGAIRAGTGAWVLAAIAVVVGGLALAQAAGARGTARARHSRPRSSAPATG